MYILEGQLTIYDQTFILRGRKITANKKEEGYANRKVTEVESKGTIKNIDKAGSHMMTISVSTGLDHRVPR